MNTLNGLDQCFSFINAQLQPQGGLPLGPVPRRVVTLSRQTGSGACEVAKHLAEFLEARAPKPGCLWTVFDRNIVEKVIEDHHLPKRIARFMPEDRISEVTDIMDELFGLHPSSWNLIHKTSETILHLAEMGNVILIGRGAPVITSKLDYAFHVRLVGSVEERVRRLMHMTHVEAAEAREFIHREDKGRERYLRTYFNKDINDPLLYHLIINTDLISPEEAGKLIGEALLARPVKDTHPEPAVVL